MERFEATVTSKGQVTLPARLRSALRLRPGDKLVFNQDASGAIHVEALQHSLADLRGMVRLEAPVTTQQVRDWIEEGRTERSDDAGETPQSAKTPRP